MYWQICFERQREHSRPVKQPRYIERVQVAPLIREKHSIGDLQRSDYPRSSRKSGWHRKLCDKPVAVNPIANLRSRAHCLTCSSQVLMH